MIAFDSCHRLRDSASTMDNEIAGLRFDEILGSGSTGNVYRATEIATGRPVAVKWLTPGAVQDDPASPKRMVREFQKTCELDHPHLVRNLRLVATENLYLLVMELVEGEDLGRRLARGPIAPLEAIRCLAAVARALGFLHDHGLIHRDVKPSNILVTTAGQAKLGDHGLVKRFNSEVSTVVTEIGFFLGSPAYVAPEIVFDEVDASPQTDMYSLGATAYHLLAGCPPYGGKSHVEVFRNVLKGPPRDLSEEAPRVPPPLAQLVHRLMSRKPDERISVQGEELSRRLEASLGEFELLTGRAGIASNEPGGRDSAPRQSSP